jgi:hypothetical protein
MCEGMRHQALVLGGLLIALGAAVLSLNEPTGARSPGFAYLGTALATRILMLVDGWCVTSNIMSLALETFSGVVLTL